MTIAQAFALYLDSKGFGTYDPNNPQNCDIFIGSAPQGSPDTIFWIKSNGGTPIKTNKTGEKQKNYILSLYYRSMSAQNVDETLQNVEEQINMDQCTQLAGFDTIDMEATSFASDEDLDNEDRTVGLVQVTITTYL